MSQSNQLFAGIAQLPQYPFETKRRKTKGVWEQPQAATTPAQSVQSANTALETSENVNTKRNADTGFQIKTAKTKAARAPDGGAKACPTQQNDKPSEQSVPQSYLVGVHVELSGATQADSWHSPKHHISDNACGSDGEQDALKVTAQGEKPHMAMLDTKPDQSEFDDITPDLTDCADGQYAQTSFTKVEAKAVEAFAKNRYLYPRVFVLLAQIGYLTDLRMRRRPNDGGHLRIATEHLLSRATQNTMDVRRAIYRNLNVALELRLLSRQDVIVKAKSTTYWKLTSDGKRFLMMGIRTRNAMRKIAPYSDEDICSQVSVDELEEWRLDAEDRAEQLSAHFGASAKRAKQLSGDKSRIELVQAIEQNAVQRIHTSGVSNLWCGLVR